MPRDVLRGTLQDLPRSAPAHRARRRPQPPLRADYPSREHKPPYAPTLLARAGPGGEVVPRVQAKAVEQDLRDGRPTARGAHPDACALLGKPHPPQTAHQLLLVGRSRGSIMTSTARNGMSAWKVNSRKSGCRIVHSPGPTPISVP